HVMSSDPKLESVPAVPGRYPETVIIGDGGQVTAAFVCGFLGCDRRPFNPLLSTLPHRLCVPGLGNGWHQSFARQVVEESRAQRAGADSVVTGARRVLLARGLRG